MLAVLRKNQQVLMLIIAILTIIAFIWLYNPTDKFRKFGSNDVLSIDGRVVQRAEIDHEARGFGLALALGLTDFVKDLGGLGADEQTSMSDFIINLLVVRHEAPALGISATDEQVATVIKGLAPFQTDGTFDPSKYSAFLQEQLAPKGFTERQLEGIVRDSISVRELRRVITSPVAVGEAQARDAARIHQAVTAQVIRFDADSKTNSASATPEEVSAFYEANKRGLIAPETRDIAFVTFELPADQQKLEGKDRANALQQLADKADHAAKTLAADLTKGTSFSKAAKAASLQTKSAPAVSRDGFSKEKDAGLPAAVVEGAFRLQKQAVLSDLIQDGNTFYLVTVEGNTPARQLSLQEVGDKIGPLLRRQKAAKATAESASKSLEQIRASLKEGKSFTDALKAAGLKSLQIGPATPDDRKQPQEQQAYLSTTLGLKEGELGALQPAPFGAFAVYLVKRDPLTDAQWKQYGPELSKLILGNQRELLFQEWLRVARGSAAIKILGGDSRRAGS